MTTSTIPISEIPTKDKTPKFCKRVDKETANAISYLKTQEELVKLGRLMETSKNPSDTSKISSDIYKIKTMTLDNLNEYVENKLSKQHYSPEVIYLLFQIQSLLLEKENLINTITRQSTTINECKKDLIFEKTLVGDLKESIKESTTELEEMEREHEHKTIIHKDQYIILSSKYDSVVYYKTLYEKILTYILPLTTFIIYNWVCRIIGNINYYFIKFI